MKKLHTYKEFINEKNELNEGLLGKLFNFFKKKMSEYAKKVKASSKIDPIIEQAKKDIDQLFDDKFKVLLKQGAEKNDTTVNDENAAQNPNNQVDGGKEQAESGVENKIVGEAVEQKVQEKSTNPIDIAIDKWLGLVKQKLAPITKDSPLAQSYANLKLIELEEMILKKQVDYYKEEMGVKPPKNLEEKAKKLANNTKIQAKKVDEEYEKKKQETQKDNPQEFNTGDTIKYTKKDGEENEAEVAEDQSDIEDGWIRLKSDKSTFAIDKTKIIK